MQCTITENNIIKLTHYDEAKTRAHDSQIVRAKVKSQVEPWWAQQKTSIRHQQTDKSFTAGPLLSLRLDLTS